jgi:nuclear pore complex protein Nup62
MAENMDTELKQMSEDLKEIIEHLNETNRTQDTSDPVSCSINHFYRCILQGMWVENIFSPYSFKEIIHLHSN